MTRMSNTIRSWSLVLPRLHWVRWTRAPLACMPIEELARLFSQWGREEVRSSHMPERDSQYVFTRDDMLLMERMGRVR